MEKVDEKKEADLEMCINKEYADLQPIPECKECEGHNYNCPSYFSISERLKYQKR
jgi:hypothetical protein